MSKALNSKNSHSWLKEYIFVGDKKDATVMRSDQIKLNTEKMERVETDDVFASET